MTCDSSSLSAGTRWVWIIPQKRLPSTAPLVWPNRWMVRCSLCRDAPVLLYWPLSPCCWFSSICLLCPSPKEASIKSPLKIKTGLDSYKLEQNNLFPNPTSTAAPHLCASSYLSHIVRGRSRERCCETESSSCLLMQTILMWADSIRRHFWMPHTLPSFTASLLLPMSLPLMYLLWQGRLWQWAELQPLLQWLISALATV